MCDLCRHYPCIKQCPNYDPYEDGFITCPRCGERLIVGDTWYPELEVCEFCIDDYEKEIETDDISRKKYVNDFE